MTLLEVINMKLMTINKDDDIDLINQANILDILVNNGYIDTDKNIIEPFEIHVKKPTERKQRYCYDCGYKFSKGERSVPMLKCIGDRYMDINYCKECYEQLH